MLELWEILKNIYFVLWCIGIGDVINGSILPHIIKFDKKTEHAFVIPDIEDYLSNSTICIMLFPNLLHYWCHRQEVLFLDNEISFNEAIIEEREQGIQEIQSQIGEVNEIFKDLAVLVHEQGAMIGNLVFSLHAFANYTHSSSNSIFKCLDLFFFYLM